MQTKLRAATKLVRATTLALRLKRHLESRLVKRKVYEQVHLKQVAEIEKSLEDALRPMFEQQLKDVAASLRLLARSEKGGPGSGPRPGQGSAHPAGWTNRINTTGSGDGQIVDKHGKSWIVQHEAIHNDGKVKHRYTITWEGAPKGVSAGGAETSWDRNRIMSVQVHTEYQRMGLASALYDHIEKHLGHKLERNWATTSDGEAFWNAREGQKNAAEKNCGTGAGGFKPGNQCARGGISISTTEEADHILKSFGQSKESVAASTGAVEGSTVKIREYKDDKDGSLLVIIEHAGYSAERTVFRNHIVNDRLMVFDNGQGLGTQVLKSQVDAASSNGYKRIETLAAGQQGSHQNGYYTWPRLGYDGNILPTIKQKAQKEFPGVSKVSDLMKTLEGRDWWKKNGRGFDAEFDLTPGSQSRKVLDEYVKAKFGGSDGGKSTGDVGRGRKDLGPDLGQDRSGCKATGVSASDVFNPRDWDEDLVNRALPPIAVASAKAMQAQLKLMGLDIVRVKKSLKGGPGSGPRPGQGRKPSPPTDDEIDKAGDDLYDLMREYHNTNDKKILSYIAEFGHPSAREAEKEAAKLTLDDKLKFDESGKTTLYRGEGGKIKKQEFHKDDLIAALPWEGEVIVRGESGPVSWTSDERWAQRFATYEHFADNIAGKSFEKGGPGSGPRVRLPMSQRQTEEARKKREERANTQIPSSVNLPEHLYLALPKAVAERAVEHGHSGETKGLLAHEENRKDSVYLATDPNVVKHYAAMTEGSVTFKIRTNSLDRGRMYYDAFEPPNEPGKAPFGDENPGYVAYRGKIPAEVFQSASQEKSYKSFEDEKNCGTGAGGFKPGNQCARGGVSFGGNVVDHGGGDADQAVHALFGRILTDDEISGLAGAPSGSNVKIVGVARSRFHIHWTNGNLKAEAERSVEGDYGHVHIENRYFETQRTSEGVGTQVFAHQVEQASKLGVKYISTDAAGHYGGELNGYYTWPRLGYDSKIPESVSGRARNKFPGVERLSDLMKTQQGRQWWKVEGFGSPMTFNLNEGSQSRKVLDEYVKAKFGGSGVEDGKSTGDDGRGRKDLGPDLGQDRQGGSGVKASGVSASDVFNPRDWDEDLVNRALPPIAVASAKAMQAQLKLMGLDISRVKKSLKNCGTGAGGFKPGNQCARGVTFSEAAGQMKDRFGFELEEEWVPKKDPEKSNKLASFVLDTFERLSEFPGVVSQMEQSKQKLGELNEKTGIRYRPSVHLAEHISGGGAQYFHNNSQIEVSRNGRIDKGYVPKIDPAAWSVGEDLGSYLRHEYFHHFQKFMSREQDTEARGVFQEDKGKVGKYGSKNHDEHFAESFSAYTSRNYVSGSLPKSTENYLRRVIGEPSSNIKSTGDDGRGRKDLGPDLGQDRSGCKATGVSASDIFNPRDWDEDLVNRALPPIAIASAKAMQAQLKLMGLDIVRVKKSLKGGPGSGPRPRGGSSSEISDQEAKQRAKEVWSPADFQFKSYNGGVSRTDAEQKAVEYWTYVKNSQKINQALRTNDRSDSEVSGAINNIDNIMKKSSLPGDVVSYRAVLLSKEPESGDKIHSVGYSATTLDSTFAKKHAENLISGADTGAGRFSDVSGIPVVMKVLLPKGSRVTTGAQSALELLVDRNSSFRVISKTKSSVFAVLEQDNVEEFKSTKASTATEWLESHQNDDRFKDLEDQVFTTPYGNVTLKIVTEYPQWMKDKIVEHLEDTFGQDYWKEINDTTFGQVDDYLKKGIQDGWSIARMADELAETLGGGDYAEWRARNIARTESGNALNGARVAAADGLIEDLGRDLPIKKVWMSVLGSTTRRSHANLDGVPADKNGRWRLGGVMCRWPGDTNLSAGERCNCQCTVIVEFGMGDDEVQQLLADYETRLITQEKEFRVWLKNCGIGSGGFQPGNTCARGGGGGSGVSKLTGNKAEAQIHASSVQELDSKWNGKLSQFLEKNPVHIHVGKVDGMGDSSGVYNAGRKRIAVKEASKSGAWNLYEPGASIAVDVASKSDSNVEHQKVTFTHELGHHLALTVTNKNKSAYLDEIISRFQKDDKKVSKYAETHPQEYFAESFAAYHHAPGKLNSTSRAMVESIMTIALE